MKKVADRSVGDLLDMEVRGSARFGAAESALHELGRGSSVKGDARSMASSDGTVNLDDG